MKGAAAIFDFLLDAGRRGEASALVTITDVVGSSSRAPGTHMAVSETGAFLGSFSGGCVEAAIVAEAQRIIDQGRAELLRFGAGSPFIDIRLPCGGGLDVLVTPRPNEAVIWQARELLAARVPLSLVAGRDGGVSVAPRVESDPSVAGDDVFRIDHDPEMRIVIVGHGAETSALAALARGYGAEVCVLSPDRALVQTVEALGAEGWWLKTGARSPHMHSDIHTAIVMLFHDHDWEEELLAQALEQDAFFIGAMGSRATQARRTQGLLDRGLSADSVARLTGPIGLIPATRDPQTLALSTLSQIVAVYQQRGAGGHRAGERAPRSPAEAARSDEARARLRAEDEYHSSLH